MKKIFFIFSFLLMIHSLSARYVDVYEGAVLDHVTYDFSDQFIYYCDFENCPVVGLPYNLPFVSVSMVGNDIKYLYIGYDLFMEYCKKPGMTYYDLPIVVKKNEYKYNCYIRIHY